MFVVKSGDEVAGCGGTEPWETVKRRVDPVNARLLLFEGGSNRDDVDEAGDDAEKGEDVL